MHGLPLQPHPRYEILGLIGSGDFAAVYRARDRELGREVAVKQIHAQYLSDPRRLERFWREAQLLASLEHPHIMTIYDIVRPNGWLVLELMQGTLLDATRGQPIDLNLLRTTLISSLQALTLLHSRGTLHGDLKPSNLLVDKLGRIKLGDFGLARRVASDQGSYLKGATRYMAPETVAPQFGPVGPASDLYSLGFTAYELMCGTQQFELLFPGLEAFGRDKQVAWMMWHAAADRRLPPVGTVLGGVPDDLARVIERLTIKDQTQRYRSAEQALADLRPAGEVVAAVDQADPEEEAAKKRAAFHRRAVAVMALAASVLVSVLVLVYPTGGKPPPAPPPDEVVRGVVRNVLPERDTLIIEDSATGSPREFRLEADDVVLLNEQTGLLRDLRQLDQVAVRIQHDLQGGEQLQVLVSRPKGDEGTIAEITPDEGTLSIALPETEQPLIVQVGAACTIELNGSAKQNGQPLSLADLRSGDRVTVQHYRDENGQTALSIAALRIVGGQGVVRHIDAKKREITLAAGTEDSAQTVVLPVAERCEVTLNGRRVLDGRLLTTADLKPGDAVTFQRDVRLVSIAAQREFQAGGTISAINYDVRSFVASDGSMDRTYLLDPTCRILLGGVNAALEDLRRGDVVSVTFDSPDAQSPQVTSISADRPPDPGKWAIVVLGTNFDDATVAGYPAASAAAARLRQTLAGRYAVPDEQLIVLDDPSRIRLEQAFPEAVSQAVSAEQLFVVFACRAVVDPDGAPQIAPKDFAAARPAETSVPLVPLLSEVERSPAKEKIVLLDLQSAVASGPAKSPPAADAFRSIQGTRSRPLLRATNVFAAKAAPSADASAPAEVAVSLAAGLAGAADPNRDNRCSASELNEFFVASASGGGPQIELFLPNSTPPRITDDAREALRRLAALLGQTKIDPGEARVMFLAASKLAPQEPEPKLLSALVQLQARQYDEALAQFREIVVARPATPLAWEASAWAKFEKRAYADGLRDLVWLLQHLPEDVPDDMAARIFPWIGRLREFSALALPADKRPNSAIALLDAEMLKRGVAESKLFDEGRAKTRLILAEMDQRIATATEPATINQLKYERWQLRHHASFSCERAAQEVLAHLDD
ncbi:MAG TPA: protein kinase [Pirellulaceae bacterium]|nr:protein kinase [Pirellulaceae bacterium]